MLDTSFVDHFKALKLTYDLIDGDSYDNGTHEKLTGSKRGTRLFNAEAA